MSTNDCNADIDHACDANDGEPCDGCAAYIAEMAAEYNRQKPWLKPARYAQDMIDGGRGHLLREEERFAAFNRAESMLPQNRPGGRR